MKGSISKRGKTSYQIQVSVGRQPDGTYKRVRETVRGTKPEAQRRLAELIMELERGDHQPLDAIKLNQLYERWMEAHVVPNLEPSTRQTYTDMYNYYLKQPLGEFQVQRIEPTHILNVLSKHGAVSSNIRRTLSSLLSYAVTLRILRNNPCRSLNATAKRRRKRLTADDVWTIEEANQFLRYVQGKNYALYFFIALLTGMRQNEIIALQWEQIDEPLNFISVIRAIKGKENNVKVVGYPKTDSGFRKVKISSTLRKALVKARPQPPKGLVLKGVRSGSFLDSGTIRQSSDRYCIQAGVRRIPPRNFRHTHATLALLGGTPMKVVQERLGHSSMSVTADIYSAVTPAQHETSMEELDTLFDVPDPTE